MNGTNRLPQGSELSLICEIRKLGAQLARLLNPDARQRARSRVSQGPRATQTILNVASVFVQLVPQNPNRRLLVVSTALGGPAVLSPAPFQGGANPVGMVVTSGTPFVMSERDWFSAVGWEWWVTSGVVPCRVNAMEVVEV